MKITHITILKLNNNNTKDINDIIKDFNQNEIPFFCGIKPFDWEHSSIDIRLISHKVDTLYVTNNQLKCNITVLNTEEGIKLKKLINHYTKKNFYLDLIPSRRNSKTKLNSISFRES